MPTITPIDEIENENLYREILDYRRTLTRTSEVRGEIERVRSVIDRLCLTGSDLSYFTKRETILRDILDIQGETI